MRKGLSVIKGVKLNTLLKIKTDDERGSAKYGAGGELSTVKAMENLCIALCWIKNASE